MRGPTIRTLFAAALSVLWCVAGCSPDGEVSARYQLEKRYYDARQLERAAYDNYPLDSYGDWRIAVSAYEAVLNSNPARIPESRNWNPDVLADMERVALSADIGLLRLGFAAYGQRAFVTHRYAPAAYMPSPYRPPERVQTPGAWVLYDSMATDSRDASLVIRMRVIAENAALWSDTQMFRDSLLAVPLGLAPFDSSMEPLADAFYTRLITTWPDSAVAASARVFRASLRAYAGDYTAALADVDTALQASTLRWRILSLRLWKAELLAFNLGRAGEGRRLLREIVDLDPFGSFAWEANLRLALLAPDPLAALREIHLEPRAPAEVAAAAMYARAQLLEREGKSDEAFRLYWRLCQRHPGTESAMAAPLHVVSALAASGRRNELPRAVEHASDYYLGVMSQEGGYFPPRNLAKDCLIEVHILAGAVQDGAELLTSTSGDLAGDNAVVARFKGALIYHYLLGDPKKSVEILEKTLEQSVGSRYARSVRRELKRAREALDGQR